MTVDERSEVLLDELFGANWSRNSARSFIRRALRLQVHECARAVEAVPDYDSNRNGFADLIDRERAADVVRALATGKETKP